MRLALLPVLVLSLLSVPTVSAYAQPAQRAQLAAKFRERLSEIARTTDGVVGISVVDLRSG